MSQNIKKSSYLPDTWPNQPDLPKLEETVLKFWQAEKVFERSIETRSKDKQFIFYDGPPFATGMPHYGHLLGSTSKDVIGRYWTMKGYKVERVWGWDCHGLPIENIIEQQLNIKDGKKGIETFGIDNFNSACRKEVLRLDKEWEKIIGRLGRWVDFKNNYKTMDTDYMESVWWGFKELFTKGLVYEGRKVILYCPRCATPLSNFEIAMDNSYAETEDFSLTVKFKVKDQNNTFFLAWTTTPWTLPGNVALAVQSKAEYLKVKLDENFYWVAKDRCEALFGKKAPQVIETTLGKNLVGLKYEPLYPYLPKESITPTTWSVLEADFVSLQDGTGIVHTAAIFGEDDYKLAIKHRLPLVPTLDENGKFLSFVKLVSGLFYKKSEEVINQDLNQRQLLFKLDKITHSYPFCYRCNTPLYYNAVSAWFIDVQKLKAKLIEENENMNWYPQHLKHGRFGKGLQEAPDWNISRSRYWGTPMPIWQSPNKKHLRVIGSIEELQEWAVNPEEIRGLTDIHRELIDSIKVYVDDKRKEIGQRIPEVFDCWVESGSMPFASKHYPFANKKTFESAYPAQFVSEYIAQTRAWFYTMHVISVGLFGKKAVENTLTTGTILAEDGSKMSKSKKNYPDPMAIINQYGVDSLRLYLMSSPVMKGENLNFNAKEVAEIRKKIFLILWNVVAFYRLYSSNFQLNPEAPLNCQDIMDVWLLSRLNTLIESTTKHMDSYDVVKTTRELINFVDELSTWYIRRSRDRFRNLETRQASLPILSFVLLKLAQLFAPFAPFFSELIYQSFNLDQVSIHLTDWPTANHKLIQPDLEKEMLEIKKIAEKAHSLRKISGIKVRQPLARAQVTSPNQPSHALLAVLADEINVKKIEWAKSDSSQETLVKLDTEITKPLKEEGEARELIRNIQKLRKQLGLGAETKIQVSAPSWPEVWQKTIEEKTHSLLVKGPTFGIL